MNDATSTGQLRRLPSDCTVEEVLEQLDVAGAVIIEDYADPDLVERIREELRP